jgi:hypothetical protein
LEAALSSVMLGGVGCQAAEPTCASNYEMESVVDMPAWEVVPAADDPFAAHRPDTVTCPAEDRVAEGTWFEVDTGGCNYLTVQQPSLRPFEAGTEAQLGLLHFDLTAAEDYVAHVAFMVGDQLLWELEKTVKAGEPEPTEAFDEQVGLDFSAPAGTPVYFHLHNHGYNTWNLFALETQVCLDE